MIIYKFFAVEPSEENNENCFYETYCLCSTGGNKRVIRGGSWFNTRGSCRTSDRVDSSPDHHFVGLGLRLALSE